MNRKLLAKLAVSGFVLGITTSGCSMNKMAAAPGKYAFKPAAAAKSADKAREAMDEGDASEAVGLAEAAVARDPRDAGYRALLGQAYLNDGRFASATAALSEAMELGARDSDTIVALSLAYIAEGKRREAVALLGAHQSVVPASDAGLALALAGDTEAAIYVLTGAARQPGADARTRQNLALAFALSGRWAQARLLAAQDLALDKIEERMATWSTLASQPSSQVRIASLIGAEVQRDAGMPVRLALSNYTDTRLAAAASEEKIVLASADPAPVESFAPPPPVIAGASEAIRTVELPMPKRGADGVVPVTELPSPAVAPAVVAPVAAPAPAAEVILADGKPYRHAPRVTGEGGERIRPAQQAALDIATRIVPKAMAFDKEHPTGWAVQLGAYDSLAIAKEKWGVLKRGNAMLAGFPASSHAAVVRGRTFHRLTVNGLASSTDARELCQQLKSDGQVCFIREMDGGETIRWAARASNMRLASR